MNASQHSFPPKWPKCPDKIWVAVFFLRIHLFWKNTKSFMNTWGLTVSCFSSRKINLLGWEKQLFYQGLFQVCHWTENWVIDSFWQRYAVIERTHQNCSFKKRILQLSTHVVLTLSTAFPKRVLEASLKDHICLFLLHTLWNCLVLSFWRLF